MRSMPTVTILAAAAVTALCYLQARAEVGDVDIGFDLGAIRFDSDVSRATGDRLAVRGGYNLTNRLQLEGQIASSTTTGVFGRDRHTELDTYMFNAVFRFERPRFSRAFGPPPIATPYVLAGAGWARLGVNNRSSIANDNSEAVQLAAGSRFRLDRSDKTALRAELAVLRESVLGTHSHQPSLQTGLSWKLRR